MGDVSLSRLLQLACRQLACTDARIEIGGAPPDDDRLVWCALSPHRRLVAIYDAAPEDPDAMRHRLEALASAFATTADTPIPGAVADDTLARAALDDELEKLCSGTKARAAVVVDATSPIVWGRSHPTIAERVGALLLSAHEPVEDATDEQRIRGVTARAVRAARARCAGSSPGALRHVETHHDFGLLLRSLAGSYLLVLAFDGSFDELHADCLAKPARSRLERLIATLPPIDPPRGGGRVLQLKKMD